MAQRSQRGAILIWAVLALTMIFTFLGLLLNVGHAISVKGQLQNASDAAALSAAHQLDGAATGIAAAHGAAALLAARHKTDGLSVSIDQQDDLQFCKWDMATNTSVWCLDWGVDPTSGPSADDPTIPQLLATNAVRVRDGRDARHGNALAKWFSGFMGTDPMNIGSRATAVGGGPCDLSQCVLPMAYVDCSFEGACNKPIVYRNDNTDTAGFTVLTDGNPSANDVDNYLTDMVKNNTCNHASGGQQIGLNNGNISAGTVWSILGTFVGKEYAIPIVHSADCKISSKNTYPIVGFGTLQITGVYRNPSDNPPAACNGATPCITAIVTCDQAVARPAGCGFFGLTNLRTQLVE